jgi:hypothetical protein
MPRLPVGDKGDYYHVDKWEHLLTYKYMVTQQVRKALEKAGLSFYYDGMHQKIKQMRESGEIPQDFDILGTDWEESKEFITVTSYWAKSGYYRFVAARREIDA